MSRARSSHIPGEVLFAGAFSSLARRPDSLTRRTCGLPRRLERPLCPSRRYGQIVGARVDPAKGEGYVEFKDAKMAAKAAMHMEEARRRAIGGRRRARARAR